MRAALLGLLLVSSALVFGACGGAKEVRFGTVDWPEAVAKTNVAATVVEALGYETEIQELSVPVVFEGLESGELDVFVEAWFPTMQPNLDAVAPGSVETVTITYRRPPLASRSTGRPAAPASVRTRIWRGSRTGSRRTAGRPSSASSRATTATR